LRKRRQSIYWNEELSDSGARDYSIFLDEQTLTLFAVQKNTDRHTGGGLPIGTNMAKLFYIS
jgi:L-rhamnose mutarotase